MNFEQADIHTGYSSSSSYLTRRGTSEPNQALRGIGVYIIHAHWKEKMRWDGIGMQIK